MIRSTAARLVLAAALVISFPAGVAAQAEAASPEGTEWHLIGYAVNGEVGIVPWYIDATLLLEDGRATGSSGCNAFSGTYLLEGEMLTFDEAFTVTRRACPGEAGAIEDRYLTNLPQTTAWEVEDGVLSLVDEDGAPLLDLEEATVALTASDVAALNALLAQQQAQMDRLGERLDNIRVGTLRERIKTLENQVKTLRAAAASSGGSGSSSGFTAAESQLLKGVPSRIRSTCKPLRASLPGGTLAAVRCSPGGIVDEMAYYLMPYDAARRTFNTVMRSHGVPERYRCDAGRPSQTLQSPYHATGCFVDDGGANVRFISWAAECHQLDVGGRRIEEPVAYIAIESTGSQIKPLFEWATRDLELTPVWRNIPHGGTPPAPACASLIP